MGRVYLCQHVCVSQQLILYIQSYISVQAVNSHTHANILTSTSSLTVTHWFWR